MKNIFTTTLLVLAVNISVFASGHTVSITSTTNAFCFGDCSGSATALASGGVGPYSYSWSGPSGYTATGATASNMCATTYAVTATDSSDMSIATVSVTINQPFQLTLTINSSGLSCENCNGAATAVASGGTAPYTYMWNDSSGFNSPNISGLCAGNYSITATDANGCAETNMITITNSPGLTLSISTTPATCGNMDGSICVNSVSGGTAPYVYIWSNVATGNCITNLNAGMYSLTVYDNSGCQEDSTIQVTNSNGLNLVLDSIVNINCSNNSAGSITVHGIGGTGIYHYLWSNGDTTATITNLNSGYYTVELYDSDSCLIFVTFQVNNTFNLYTSIQTTNANCTNNGSASITSVTGLYPPFTFLWNDPLNQTTQTATNLYAGSYQVTITNAIGCFITANTNIPLTNYNIIKGRIYFDANQNCVQDIGEYGIPNISVHTNPGYSYGYTNSSGDYTIYTNLTNCTISASSYYLNNYSPTCPISGTINVNFTTSCDTSLLNDFGYYADQSFFDLRIFQNWSNANPGFTITYRLYGYNNSPTYQNAILRLTYDPVLQYTSSNLNGVNNSTLHTVEWTANNIAPYSFWSSGPAFAYFYVPTSVSITDTLCSLFEIFPITGDALPSDNTRSFCQLVTGSYDPNSKDVIPRGQGAQGLISTNDSILYYTIHFQNTGNDTAFTVIVVDTLSQYLDPGTIVPGASSHPYTFTLTEHGILTFRFDQIMLPDSNVNEPGSNGFFNYTVNLKPNLPIGTLIENKAFIFFDFNEPIVTNTTINTIASPLQIKEIENNVTVSVFPNPFSDYTMFEIHNGKSITEYSVYIYDMLGKCIKSIQNITENSFKVSAKGLESGIYLYKVMQNKEVAGIGKIIIE